MTSRDNPVVLAVRDLRTYLFTRQGVGRAVDGVSFELRRGLTLGLVGESGAGKSLTALSLVGMPPQPAARIVGGQVLFRGEDLLTKPPSELRRYRGRHIAVVLQDPMTALNPVMSIGDQLGAPLRFHRNLGGAALRQRVIELLKLFRIPDPERRLGSYPHEFSGGMRQRVLSAIAVSCGPDVLIADEPTSALDVTVQAAYLALLREIQRTAGLASLFITHDFRVVAKICDAVAVMYAGKLVETGPTSQILQQPAHPYTEALVSCVPDVRLPAARLPTIVGQPPSIYAIPGGCPFAPRCPYVMSRCQREFPPTVQLRDGHEVSCWRYV
jgi:oligopeptide/dipeptide ABC transporter ATP-binding protein